jgi:arylsulfatase A-like enzyme
LFLSIFTVGVITGCDRRPEQPPNIILFLVDDMGWQDTSVPFWKETTPLNRKFHTPNMERLASEGMKFTQGYACSVCSPTRISLMTGMNAARHRVTNWTLRKNASNDARHPILEFPEWNVNGMSAVDTVERTVYATPLPALLQEAGYYTIHAGKAHFGAVGTPGADPRNIGFNVNIAGHAAGGPGSYLGTQNFSAAWRGGATIWDVPGLEAYYGNDIFLTEALTIEANKAMDDAVRLGKPFFLYMAHYAVHVPFAPDDRFIAKYLSAGLDSTEAMYAALVEGMDKSLGDLMENVQKHGVEDQTVVLFMSDNGGLSAHGRGNGPPHTHNKPLSSGKGSAHEGGIREPMLVKWPGRVQPGSVCSDYLIIEDFFPTILEIAGVSGYRTVQHIDGKSFMPMLRQAGTTSTGRDLFWHYPNNWGPAGPGIGATSTIRSGDWKLIYYYLDQHFDLYNIAEDIGEHNNLVGKQPERVKQLSDKLGKYLRSVDAQRPSFKEGGEIAPWPDEAITKKIKP